MSRRKTTLSIDAELIDGMKIQAVREKRDVSTITEELYRNYLDRVKAAPAQTKKRKP
jgi:hypothetical protein